MSGHSKWHNIQKTKEKMDSKRGKIFTKIGKEIVVAVKMGGGADPNSNAQLRAVIAKAKAANMPNDNIKRSIQKASGEGSTANYESITYEGYGVGGSALIVECLTDNKNRTAGDVRHWFDKFGGSLGSTGCVSYLFSRNGVLVFEKSDKYTEDEVLEWALDAGASDVITEDEVYQVITEPSTFESVKNALEGHVAEFLTAEIQMVPSSYIDLSAEQYESFEKLVDALEDLDDVQEVYHNVSEQ
ncbi:MAG: YebC/PmpR family DNA-binding transcriptional regulator [Clostridiales bacterium]|nr:YebC/PmpR family DNA-binding transcriptional regulator [Candidatus Apopatousia equi]